MWYVYLPHLKHPLGADAYLVSRQSIFCWVTQETVLATTLGGRREEEHEMTVGGCRVGGPLS